MDLLPPPTLATPPPLPPPPSTLLPKLVSTWDVDAVVAWLQESKLGEFEKNFRDNEIDGNTLLKLSESMVVRLFPTIKLEVQFLDLLTLLKQRHMLELAHASRPHSSSKQNSNHHQRGVAGSSSSFDNGTDHSNSNSPTPVTNGHVHPYNSHPHKSSSSTPGYPASSTASSTTPAGERSQLAAALSSHLPPCPPPPNRLSSRGVPPPPKQVKREPKQQFYPGAHAQQSSSPSMVGHQQQPHESNGNGGSSNGDQGEHDTKHSFPHVYTLPEFSDTLKLALASQDASAFKLRTYYRNLLISSIYDDLTHNYNLWYPNARQYKTVATALVKVYPFLETSTDGGEGAWVDGIKGKFKRGRRTVTNYMEGPTMMGNGGGSGDDEGLEGDKHPGTTHGHHYNNNNSNGHKRSRQEYEVNSYGGSDDGDMMGNGTNGKENDQNSDNNEELDEEEVTRLRGSIVAMQNAFSETDEPELNLIADFFKETFEVRRNFVKTHNTTEILQEYPALQLHTCLLADFHMQTNIPIQTVFVHKLRSISKHLIQLANETGCAPEVVHSYNKIVAQRPHLDQSLADTFAILIVARYFDEHHFLLISPEKEIQSPWPIIRGDHPANAFFDANKSLSYNIELDYVQLFHRPLNDFLTAVITLFATYTVFEITYGKLEMTLSFIDCLLKGDSANTARAPQVLELFSELSNMK